MIFDIFENRIAGKGSYEDLSIGAGAGAGAGATEKFYSEPDPEPEHFLVAGAGAGADQKCHGSASLVVRAAEMIPEMGGLGLGGPSRKRAPKCRKGPKTTNATMTIAEKQFKRSKKDPFLSYIGSPGSQGRIQDFSQGWSPSDGLVLECY